MNKSNGAKKENINIKEENIKLNSLPSIHSQNT